MPLLGMMALLALTAGVGTSIYRRRRASTRNVQVYQDVLMVEEVEDVEMPDDALE